MIRFLINIPIELREKLKFQAKQKGQTLTGLIRDILWDWVEDCEKSLPKK